MKNFTLIVTLNLCLMSFGQNLIHGTISDEFGVLSGANVIIKNTTTGVATDEEGNFKIKALPTDTITFSYLGYKPKEILVGYQKVINVNLESNIELDEVLINAYASDKRISFIICGSYSVIEENELQIENVGSVLFPNPSPNGRFQLRSTEIYQNVDISVSSINGQLVRRIKLQGVEGNINIDLSNLPSGIYLISTIADGVRLQTKKAIKK